MTRLMSVGPEGTLTDTGPLYALVDPQGQPEQFARCAATFPTLDLPLVTTWPCLAEAMYLTGRTDGWDMQRLIADYVATDTLRLHMPARQEVARTLQLMEQYADRPMNLADASLIALAEAQGYTRIFSIDSDFYVYRLADGSTLEVVPGPAGRARR
jgi:predicted nucleic acid-binding protein